MNLESLAALLLSFGVTQLLVTATILVVILSGVHGAIVWCYANNGNASRSCERWRKDRAIPVWIAIAIWLIPAAILLGFQFDLLPRTPDSEVNKAIEHYDRIESIQGHREPPRFFAENPLVGLRHARDLPFINAWLISCWCIFMGFWVTSCATAEDVCSNGFPLRTFCKRSLWIFSGVAVILAAVWLSPLAKYHDVAQPKPAPRSPESVDAVSPPTQSEPVDKTQQGQESNLADAFATPFPELGNIVSNEIQKAKQAEWEQPVSIDRIRTAMRNGNKLLQRLTEEFDKLKKEEDELRRKGEHLDPAADEQLRRMEYRKERLEDAFESAKFPCLEREIEPGAVGALPDKICTIVAVYDDGSLIVRSGWLEARIRGLTLDVKPEENLVFTTNRVFAVRGRTAAIAPYRNGKFSKIVEMPVLEPVDDKLIKEAMAMEPRLIVGGAEPNQTGIREEEPLKSPLP